MSFRVCFAAKSVSVFIILFAVPGLQVEVEHAANLAPTSYQTDSKAAADNTRAEKGCRTIENHPFHRVQSLPFLAILEIGKGGSDKKDVINTIGTVIHPYWLMCSYFDFTFMHAKLNFLPIEKIHVKIEEPNQLWRKGKILRAVPHYRSHVERENSKVSRNSIILLKTNDTAAYWKPVRLPLLRSQTDDCKQGLAYGFRKDGDVYCYSGFKHYLFGKNDECQPPGFPLIRREKTICSRPCGYGSDKTACWHGSPLFCDNDSETILGIMYIVQGSADLKGFIRIDYYIDFIRSTIYPELYNPESHSHNPESYNNCGKSKYKPHRISLLYFCVVILCINYLQVLLMIEN